MIETYINDLTIINQFSKELYWTIPLVFHISVIFLRTGYFYVELNPEKRQ